MFFPKKVNILRSLPRHWQSPLHNKCNISSCSHPNPPQVAAGHYVCKGTSSKFAICEGTYYVSPERARNAHLYWKEQFRREAEEQQRIRARQEAEVATQGQEECRQHRKGEAHRRKAAEALQVQHGPTGSPESSLERNTARRKRHGEPLRPSPMSPPPPAPLRAASTRCDSPFRNPPTQPLGWEQQDFSNPRRAPHPPMTKQPYRPPLPRPQEHRMKIPRPLPYIGA